MLPPAGMAFNNRILNILWYGSLAGPLVIASCFLAFDLEIGVGWLPSRLLWNGTLLLLALLLAAARPLARHLLAPARVAARPVPAAMLAGDDLVSLALAKVQVVSMLAAAVLNALPMILTVLAVLHAEAQLALVIGVLALVIAWLAKPDFVPLVGATAAALKRSGG
jgi:hypothetical protein